MRKVVDGRADGRKVVYNCAVGKSAHNKGQGHLGHRTRQRDDHVDDSDNNKHLGQRQLLVSTAVSDVACVLSPCQGRLKSSYCYNCSYRHNG